MCSASSNSSSPAMRWCGPSSSRADQLRRFCAATKRWHSRRARRGAAYVRDGVDSPMETRLRMLLVLAGLPEPEVNHKIRDARGWVLRRLDLSYPAARLIVEYDGRHHAESRGQWKSDLERREELDEQDWRLIVVVSDGIFKHPEHTIARVARALRSRGVRVGPLRRRLETALSACTSDTLMPRGVVYVASRRWRWPQLLGCGEELGVHLTESQQLWCTARGKRGPTGQGRNSAESPNSCQW